MFLGAWKQDEISIGVPGAVQEVQAFAIVVETQQDIFSAQQSRLFPHAIPIVWNSRNTAIKMLTIEWGLEFTNVLLLFD